LKKMIEELKTMIDAADYLGNGKAKRILLKVAEMPENHCYTC